MATLNVMKIFESISGEGGYFDQGEICTFIRLAGCNLKCDWCDTPQSQNMENGIEHTIDEILLQINPNIRNIIITGGEPLLQMRELEDILTEFKKLRYRIAIETNGSIFPSNEILQNTDGIIIDYKLGSSKVLEDDILSVHEYAELCSMHNRVYIKFVLSHDHDLMQLIQIRNDILIKYNNMNIKNDITEGHWPRFLYSPILDRYKPLNLFKKLLEYGIFNGTINLQLHKLIDMR